MLIPARLTGRIVDGEVDLAFRRWTSPRVAAGSRFISNEIVVEVTSVEEITLADITDDDARRAGFDSVADAGRRCVATKLPSSGSD
ncbi:hypothetical protein ACWDPV_06890 [Gordonia sp. NPDC003504]